MTTTLTWHDIEQEARKLEITFEQDEQHDSVTMRKHGGPAGWFQDSPAGMIAALDWLSK